MKTTNTNMIAGTSRDHPLQGRRRVLRAFGPLSALAALGMGTMPLSALADGYPEHPLRLIVPMAPGGGADISMRLIAQKMQALWKPGVFVENRGGGTGAVGLTLVKSARPDGYTIVLCTASHAALQATRTDLPYDLLKDFVPVGQLTLTPYVLVVNPAVPAKTVDEVIKLSHQRPNGLTYGSAGIGSMQELAGQLLVSQGHARLLHVPYTGGGPAMAAVLGGQLDMIFATPQEAVPLVRSGRLRAIAVTGAQRSNLFPGIPTVAESGLKGYEVTQFYGVLAPAGTPAQAVATLNRDFTATVESPEVKQRLADEGQQVVTSTPEQFRAFLVNQIQQFKAAASGPAATGEKAAR
ncbi:Bug family tripartite tricarboxylate transporter substrate binding protein [Bordetella genomosp. 9]|uniref:Bug family tripartite tricarboxylate transporter substrate binding protein n=1 Tax=Bordetella genomosp. 9 TaxID=1416803 RepID=UPI0015C5FE15|nr:tripartite tricarboxylate transporter substrate binding protein [Bordetella genomosp. 9]